MKQVSMLYKRLNFNATGAGRFKMQASLKHSLRVVDEHNESEKSAGLQWDESKTDNNLVLINDQLLAFKDFSLDKREKFIADCFAPKQPQNKKTLVKNYSAYKIKLENAIAKETNDEAKLILQSLRDYPQDQEIDADIFIEQLDAVNVVRKNQRINMAEKFANAHNALLGTFDKKKTYIQEGLFKFPRPPKDKNRDELTDELSAEDYIYHMRNFLKVNFPNHEVKAIFAHLDEDKVHSHYFLSGVNSKTNELDLNKREIEVVNNYIATLKSEIDVEAELIPENKKLNYAERQRFGRYFQRYFYEYTNQNLLLPRGVEAVIADEAERQSDVSIQRNIENNLPLGLRSHNHATLKVELAERELQKKTAQGKALIKRVNEITAAKKIELYDIKSEIAVGKAAISTNEQININLMRKNNALSIELKQKDITLNNLINTIVNKENDNKNLIIEMDKELASKKEELDHTEKLINERVKEANLFLSNSNKQLDKNDELLAQKNNELQSLESQITMAKNILNGFTDQITRLVGNVIHNIQIRHVALSKGLGAASDYAKKIMTDYANIAPAFLRDICKIAAKDAKDTEIVKKMESKDQELDKDSETKDW